MPNRKNTRLGPTPPTWLVVQVREERVALDASLRAAVASMPPAARQCFAFLSGPGAVLREGALLERLRALDPQRWAVRDGRDVLLVLGVVLARLRHELDRHSAPVRLHGSAAEGWTIAPAYRCGPVRQGGEPAEGHVPPEAQSFTGRVLRGGRKERA